MTRNLYSASSEQKQSRYDYFWKTAVFDYDIHILMMVWSFCWDMPVLFSRYWWASIVASYDSSDVSKWATFPMLLFIYLLLICLKCVCVHTRVCVFISICQNLWANFEIFVVGSIRSTVLKLFLVIIQYIHIYSVISL